VSGVIFNIPEHLQDSLCARIVAEQNEVPHLGRQHGAALLCEEGLHLVRAGPQQGSRRTDGLVRPQAVSERERADAGMAPAITKVLSGAPTYLRDPQASLEVIRQPLAGALGELLSRTGRAGVRTPVAFLGQHAAQHTWRRERPGQERISLLERMPVLLAPLPDPLSPLLVPILLGLPLLRPGGGPLCPLPVTPGFGEVDERRGQEPAGATDRPGNPVEEGATSSLRRIVGRDPVG